MSADNLTRDLFTALRQIPLLDPHSHIDPFRPTAKTLDDLLGYHYYTELAHSAGMSHEPLSPQTPPRERVRAILEHSAHFDNTAQFGWLLDIARTYLGFQGDRLTAADTDALWDAAERTFAQPDWEEQVFRQSNLEKIFLTNEFDDPLEGYDVRRYVPCLRTDTLVFHGHKRDVQERLTKVTGVDVDDIRGMMPALKRLFGRFTRAGAKACAISLPPDFMPADSQEMSNRHYVFWQLAECCREFRLPFDLMIGVNRNVYRNGVHQGRDLFDQRTSLLQYEDLFNAFPEVTFCVSVLSSAQNQELVSHAWIFPNVIASGHWWYSNVPAYIAPDLRARLQAVPKTKLLGYYSDAYKLEFVLPKYDMYRRVLAGVLADDFVRPGVLSEARAVELGRQLLRDNVQRVFQV